MPIKMMIIAGLTAVVWSQVFSLIAPHPWGILEWVIMLGVSALIGNVVARLYIHFMES